MCLGYIGVAVILFIWAVKRFAILPGGLNPTVRMEAHGATAHD
jgi:hypothetical protein